MRMFNNLRSIVESEVISKESRESYWDLYVSIRKSFEMLYVIREFLCSPELTHTNHIRLLEILMSELTILFSFTIFHPSNLFKLIRSYVASVFVAVVWIHYSKSFRGQYFVRYSYSQRVITLRHWVISNMPMWHSSCDSPIFAPSHWYVPTRFLADMYPFPRHFQTLSNAACASMRAWRSDSRATVPRGWVVPLWHQT